MQPAVDGILEQLTARGGRITSNRRALLSALVASGDHVTAEELTTAVRVTQPDLAPSPIYHILDDLENLWVVVHVHLGHGPAVYYFADSSHGHLVCDACGAVTELP